MVFFLSYKYVILSFVKLLQKNGHKEFSELCLHICLCFIKKFEKKKPFLVMRESFYKTKPFCEIKNIRISGTNYKLPVEIKPEKQKSIFFRWLLMNNTNLSSAVILSSNLSKEIAYASNNSSKIIKLCDNFHKLSETNKMYLDYRF